MSDESAIKHARLTRLKDLVDQHESTMESGLRGFLYSTGNTSSEAGRKYVFHDQQVVGIDAALAVLEAVALRYDLLRYDLLAD